MGALLGAELQKVRNLGNKRRGPPFSPRLAVANQISSFCNSAEGVPKGTYRAPKDTKGYREGPWVKGEVSRGTKG